MDEDVAVTLMQSMSLLSVLSTRCDVARQSLLVYALGQTHIGSVGLIQHGPNLAGFFMFQ